MIQLGLEAIFWGSTAFIGWVYLGFPLVLGLRSLIRRPVPRSGGALPDVSYVIVVHNERAVIEGKLANVEEIEYPREHLQVIVASDGSFDGTNECVENHAGATNCQLIELERVGKNAALNAGVAAATGEILVFSDADSMLEPESLAGLVAPFSDPGVGGVGGDYRYEKGVVAGEAERIYWSFDRFWKQLQCRGGSMTSATGQIYAIRRRLFSPVPDGVTDDFYVSTSVIAAGLRLWFEPSAIARGPVARSTEAEFRRKVRMIGRGFSSVWHRRGLLDPLRTGFYSLQLLSHKVLRRLVGLPLLGLALSAPLLSSVHPFYLAVALAQLAFHSLALAGWLGRQHPFGHARVLALPLFFDMANLAALVGFSDFVRGRQNLGWAPERSTDPADESASARASAQAR